MTCCELHKVVQKCDWYRTDTWSFNDALGDTIMEKYESLYVKLHQLHEKCGGAVSIICGKDVASIFECATAGFEPEPWPENISLFDLGFYKCGRINKRFDVFVDKDLTDTIYVNGRTNIIRLKVKDFII